jgi:hypothetical protein
LSGSPGGSQEGGAGKGRLLAGLLEPSEPDVDQRRNLALFCAPLDTNTTQGSPTKKES